jgi:hypothetical protein
MAGAGAEAIPSSGPLQSVSIFERDVLGDVILSWSFPAVPKSLREGGERISLAGLE